LKAVIFLKVYEGKEVVVVLGRTLSGKDEFVKPYENFGSVQVAMKGVSYIPRDKRIILAQ